MSHACMRARGKERRCVLSRQLTRSGHRAPPLPEVCTPAVADLELSVWLFVRLKGMLVLHTNTEQLNEHTASEGSRSSLSSAQAHPTIFYFIASSHTHTHTPPSARLSTRPHCLDQRTACASARLPRSPPPPHSAQARQGAVCSLACSSSPRAWQHASHHKIARLVAHAWCASLLPLRPGLAR